MKIFSQSLLPCAFLVLGLAACSSSDSTGTGSGGTTGSGGALASGGTTGSGGTGGTTAGSGGNLGSGGVTGAGGSTSTGGSGTGTGGATPGTGGTGNGSGGATAGSGGSSSGGTTGSGGGAGSGGSMGTGGSSTTGGGGTNASGYTPKIGYNCPNLPKPVCNTSNPTSYTPLTGSNTIHDPNVAADASCNFYAFATGQIGPGKKSTDLVAWSAYSAPVTSAASSGAQIWAADATFANGQFYVYFSIWHGAIDTAEVGLVTNKTLVTTSADYKWVDDGSIVNRSNGGNLGLSGKSNVNIIDPNLFIDDDGSWWLIYGSFNDGVRLIPLDNSTGKPKDNPLKPTVITDHLGEGSSLMRNGNYYYVMVSRGGCCSGTSSSYEVVYARSTSVTGPYTTKSGQSFSTSSYTDSTDALMPVGFEGDPGGQGGSHMFRVNGQWYIDYHAYVANYNPARFVVRPIYFDSSGWATFDCTKAAG